MVWANRERIHVLVVDQDSDALSTAQVVLEGCGYAVQTARSAYEAMQAVRNHPETVDLLLTDIALPDLNGTQLAESVRRIVPRMAVVLMSRFPGVVTRYGPLVAKPLKPAALSLVIDGLVRPERDKEESGRSEGLKARSA